MSMNTITLVGHAGRDPELRFFDSGSAVAHLTLAVNKASSNREEEPDWFNLEIWGKQAQVAADHVRKGSLIGVIGRMTSERWTDRSTGEQRSKPVVKVDRLALLGSRADKAQSQFHSSAAAAQGPAGPGSTAGQPAGTGSTAASPPPPPSWSSDPRREEEVPF